MLLPVAGEENHELGPLPPGRHGFSRDQVAHSQRERLIAGLAQVVNERGYNETTIAHITSAAQVSRRTFYEHFESKEACFLAAFDIVIEHLHRLIGQAIEPIPDWPHRIAAGLRAMLRFFAEEPELARLTMVDSLTAGPAVAERYREVIFSFTPLLEPGREEREGPRPLPDSTEDTVIGSLASAITRSIMLGDNRQSREAHPRLHRLHPDALPGPQDAKRISEEAVPGT